MSDLLKTILGLAVGVSLVGGIAYVLENRAKTKGALFVKPAGPSSRIFAFFLSIVFGGFTILEIYSIGKYQIAILLITIALFLYSIGFDKLLRNIQNISKDKETKDR